MDGGASRLTALAAVLRTMGVPWTVRRLTYELRRRSGLLARRFPALPWDRYPLASLLRPGVPSDTAGYDQWRRAQALPRFPGAAESETQLLRDLRGPGEAAVQAEAGNLATGRLRYWGAHDIAIGSPPRWHLNPWTQAELPRTSHWTRIAEFGDSGDVKCVWEASRGTWAFLLARAYATSRDERWAELFWSWVEDWIASNAPNLGPNWMCGQETALRAMAWIWAAEVLRDARASTPERHARLTVALAVHGRRIEANLGYGLLQKNNHGLSEAAGLLTLGLFLPELAAAHRWKALGRETLERELARQIYDDGSYVQHSVNYHRVMLQLATWALAIGDAAGAPLPAETRERVNRAAWWLYGIQDEETGWAPHYGHDDGAHVFPLAATDYRDMRPAVAAALQVTAGRRLYPPGPWDEPAVWLLGAEALRRPVEPAPRTSGAWRQGGYYTLRGERSFAFIRCARLADRPAQADMLHLDLWWRGKNVVLDPGTYAYHDGHPWDVALGGTAAHSTVTLDGADQMQRVARFLWRNWCSGRVIRRQPLAGLAGEVLEVEIPRYRTPARTGRHARALVRFGNLFVVVDHAWSEKAVSAEAHWLLPDAAWDVQLCHARLSLNGQCFVVAWDTWPRSLAAQWHSGNDTEPRRGWEAPGYRTIRPARSLILTTAAGPLSRFLAAFGEDVLSAGFNEDCNAAVVRTSRGMLTLVLRDLSSGTLGQIVATEWQPAEAAR